MNLDGLLQKAKSGDMAAQYELAEYYGDLLKETDDEEEIVRYSREAMIWLRKSAKQGYGPAVDAVKELDEDDPDDLDAAAAATAAAVASAVESFDSDFSNVPTPPEAKPLDIESDDDEDEDDFDPFGPIPDGEKRRNGNPALACILIISLLINILVILFLIKIFRDRRNPQPPKPTNSVSDTAAPTSANGPDDGQGGEASGGQGGEDHGSQGGGDSGDHGSGTSEPTASPEVTATPAPTPGTTVTPAPTPTPGATATPAPTDKPFWIDLDAHPELELKPGRDSLYSDYVYYIVTADNLNVRSGPDTRYTKIANLGLSDKVGAVGKYGNWYLVAVGDKLGWVSGSYLTSDLNWKPETTPEPTHTPTPTPPPVTAPPTVPPTAPPTVPPTAPPTVPPTVPPTAPPTETPVPGGDSSSGDLNPW